MENQLSKLKAFEIFVKEIFKHRTNKYQYFDTIIIIMFKTYPHS